MRQAGRVAGCPAAGCSRLSSFICCVPIIPQVRPGMSSAGRDRRRKRRTRRNPFHGRGRAAKGRPCGFFWLRRVGRLQPKAGASPLLAIKCCIENKHWADLLDWKICRLAARPKKMGRTLFRKRFSARAKLNAGFRYISEPASCNQSAFRPKLLEQTSHKYLNVIHNIGFRSYRYRARLLAATLLRSSHSAAEALRPGSAPATRKVELALFPSLAALGG